MSPALVNALTIDVEDYFQVSALAPHFPRSEWDTQPCRVESNVEIILELLHEAGVKATFFTLGWIAERYPHLVRRIAEQGHEVASHGYAHYRATDQSQPQFSADIKLAKAVLEDVSGQEVVGYRAPSFSIGRANSWAFDAIALAGYRYSSSVYPIRHDHYGAPDFPRFAHLVRDGLLELPITTVRLMTINLPAGGGGYFRLMPYPLARSALRWVNGRDRQPAIFYFHPWELDPDQPRAPALSPRTRFRHYLNLRHMRERIRRLLRDFQWGRLDQIFLGQAQ
jgi:polysaccharide deacetylase family protein (PEP-CTERM system associated)